MKTQVQKDPKTKKAPTAKAVQKREKEQATVQFQDKREATTQLKKIQSMASTSPKMGVIQRRKGSHGKAKKLNVKGTYTDGGAPSRFNLRDEKIGLVKGHGGYVDEAAEAEAYVRSYFRLSATATITITSYKFYTAR